MTTLPLLLLALLATGSEERIFYAAPDTATPEELTKAAQAMTQRLKGYGYKGVRVELKEQGIRKGVDVISEAGFTLEMRETLAAFAEIAGATLEVRFPVALSDVEREQYQPRVNPGEDKAPAGAKWYRWRNSSDAPVLLADAPVVQKAEIQIKTGKDRSGAPQTTWEISRLQTRELYKGSKERPGLAYLVADGGILEKVSLNDLERNEDGKVAPAERWSFTPSSRIVRESLANPMPFPLQVERSR